MSKLEIVFFVGVIAIFVVGLAIFYWLEWRRDRRGAYNQPVSQYSEEEMILGKALQAQARIQEDEYYTRQAMMDEFRNYSHYANRAQNTSERKEADRYE